MDTTKLAQHPNLDPDDKVTIDRTLWLNASRDALVEDGDPGAAFLYATAGKSRPRAEAESLGYKQAEAPEDKQDDTPEDKGHRTRRTKAHEAE